MHCVIYDTYILMYNNSSAKDGLRNENTQSLYESGLVAFDDRL